MVNFTATLLTSPQNPSLERGQVESLRHSWGGKNIHWLSPREAAEFSFDMEPKGLWKTWDHLQKMGIDLVVQPPGGRRKRMLLADMDSTIIQQECIDELAEEAGIGDRVKEITARAMDGKLNFEEALTERVALLKGLDEAVITKVWNERITWTPGGKVLLATMKKHGAHTALVSGGFTVFTQRVANALGFHEHRANSLHIENGQLTGTVGLPILGREAKIEALEEITDRLALQTADVLAVGDGANDLGMLGRAGTGVALHAKPSVAAQCDMRVNHGDLTALLYLQGYSQEEFVDV